MLTEPHAAVDSGQRSKTAWLTSLRLVAVQPACLRAHSDILQQQHQQHLPAHAAGVAGDAVGAPRQLQEHDHDMLLHLEAGLSMTPPLQHTMHKLLPFGAGTDSGAQAVMLHSAAEDAVLPSAVVLQHAELELVFLTQQMQLLQRQKVSLLQLIQQQQGQIPAEAVGLGIERDSLHEMATSNPCRCNTIQHESSDSFVLLNLQTSVPSRPADHSWDCLQLVLMVSSRAGTATCNDISNASSSAAPGQFENWASLSPTVPCVVADVSVLVLPAAAQQEVQQLLLPAMRQEVQAEHEMHHPQLQLGPGCEQQSAAHFAHQCMMVEHAAWKHYCQMANDIYAVLQLSAAAAAEAEAAANSQSIQVTAPLQTVGNQITAAGSAPANDAASPSRPFVLLPSAISAAEASAAAAQQPSAASSLQHIAQTLLLPLLLPFLAAQGMYGTLHLLLSCLPQRLQQQWHQQQIARLQELTVTAPSSLRLPLTTVGEQRTPVGRQCQPHVASLPSQASLLESSDNAADTVADTAEALPQQDSSAVLHQRKQGKGVDDVLANVGSTADGVSDSTSSKCLQDSCRNSDEAGSGKAVVPVSSIEGSSHQTGSTRWLSSGDVAWYSPLIQFDDEATEQRYLAWKQHSLLHLDFLSMLFGLFYLAVLLHRMMSEPTTLVYFSLILTKVLPFVPLMLGQQQLHLRYREFLISSIAPTMAMLALLLSVFSWLQGKSVVLLPNKAYKAYWSSRGELSTAAMRAFTHHMRLSLYIPSTLLDACVCVWMFSKVFGLWEAIVRYCVASVVSVGLAWGLEWYMRFRFVRMVNRQQLRQQ